MHSKVYLHSDNGGPDMQVVATLHPSFVNRLDFTGQFMFAPLECILRLKQSLGQSDEDLRLTHSVVFRSVLQEFTGKI